MTVFLFVGSSSVAVTGIVTGSLPQSKVMIPPWVTAALSASNVQLAAVPVPTTVVGLVVSAGCPLAGTPALHEPLGLPLGPLGPPPPVGVPAPPEPQDTGATSAITNAKRARMLTSSAAREDSEPAALYPVRRRFFAAFAAKLGPA
jgi:hypothetical protein